MEVQAYHVLGVAQHLNEFAGIDLQFTGSPSSTETLYHSAWRQTTTITTLHHRFWEGNGADVFHLEGIGHTIITGCGGGS